MAVDTFSPCTDSCWRKSSQNDSQPLNFIRNTSGTNLGSDKTKPLFPFNDSGPTTCPYSIWPTNMVSCARSSRQLTDPSGSGKPIVASKNWYKHLGFSWNAWSSRRFQVQVNRLPRLGIGTRTLILHKLLAACESSRSTISNADPEWPRSSKGVLSSLPWGRALSCCLGFSQFSSAQGPASLDTWPFRLRNLLKHSYTSVLVHFLGHSLIFVRISTVRKLTFIETWRSAWPSARGVLVSI